MQMPKKFFTVRKYVLHVGYIRTLFKGIKYLTLGNGSMTLILIVAFITQIKRITLLIRRTLSLI